MSCRRLKRLYTKLSERLVTPHFYKENAYDCSGGAAPEALSPQLVCGNENIHGDLVVEFWLVRAARSMPELALLKSMYTLGVRRRLSTLLHRIEYGINTDESVTALWRLYDEAGLFPDFVAAFIRTAVMHRERLYEVLSAKSKRAEMAEILAAAEEVNEVEPALVAGGVFR